MSSLLIIAIIALPFYVLGLYFLRRHRRWLFYYVFGAFGFTLLVALLMRVSGLEEILTGAEVFQTNIVANLIGIPSEAMTLGRLKLEVDGGWSILQVNVECSAVLEMGALAGLLIFYPAFTVGQKIIKVTVGVVLTYLTNIARVLIILAIDYFFGINYVFVAHAAIGRIFFFVCVIAIFWYLITKPTVASIGNFLQRGLRVTPQTLIGESRRAVVKSSLLMIFLLAAVIPLVTLSFWNRASREIILTRRPETPTARQAGTGSRPSATAETTEEIKAEAAASLQPEASEGLQPEAPLSDSEGLVEGQPEALEGPPDLVERKPEAAEGQPESTPSASEGLAEGQVETVPAEETAPPTPEENTESIATIDAVTTDQGDGRWFCQLEDSSLANSLELYYVWVQVNGQKKILFPATSSPVSEFEGIPGEDWRCYVITYPADFDKINPSNLWAKD